MLLYNSENERLFITAGSYWIIFSKKLRMLSRFFVPILKRYCVSRMDRLRREDDGKGRQIKKAQDAEQSLLSKVHINFWN